MKKIRNNKGFTLVELLAVIVVLAIVMGIASIAITNVLDSTRKKTFASSAEMYIEGARDLISLAEMLSDTTVTLPKCAATGNTSDINLGLIKTEGGESSPYGGDYNKTKSFVRVTATPATAGDYTSCNYVYSIYLTDDTYAIGTATSPVAESSIEASSVQTETAD